MSCTLVLLYNDCRKSEQDNILPESIVEILADKLEVVRRFVIYM
jgi:hypothetical protein